MCPSLIEIGSKKAEKNSAQTNRQTDRHYKNNGHLAVNQLCFPVLAKLIISWSAVIIDLLLENFYKIWPPYSW